MIIASLRRRLTRLLQLVISSRHIAPARAVPAGVKLNPSDVDFAAYDLAPLALTWGKNHGGDTRAWQNKARTKLAELLGIRRIPKGPLPAAIVDAPVALSARYLMRQTFYLPSALNRFVPVTVVWDTRFALDCRPVMLCLQGHTSGAHISWGQTLEDIDSERIANGGDYALQAVKCGYVACCVEQIAFGVRKEQRIAHRWDHSCVDACNRALLLGRTVLGDRVADISAVIDWLHASGKEIAPSTDIGSIFSMGNSAGGETALFAAAIDQRIAGVIASGCVGQYRKTSGVRRTCPDTVIPGILEWFEYEDILALCAPRAVLVISGRNDHIYPFALADICVNAARPAFAALSANERLVAVEGPAGHRFYPDLAWARFREMLTAG